MGAQPIVLLRNQGPCVTSPIQASPAEAIRVRVIQDAEEFAALAKEWEELQRCAAITSVFETFDWQHLWWQSYGKGKPLRLLVAMAGDAIVGILPLYIHTLPMMRYPVRLLRFVGSGGDTSPDDLGPILSAGREHIVARALAEAALELREWDVLDLSDMNPACAFTTAMAEVANAAQLETLKGRSERITYIELPPTWERFLETLSGHRRRLMRYNRKKLSTSHASRFFIWDDPSKMDEAFDRLAQLHHKRFSRVVKNHGFTSPEYLGFHRAVMKACMSRDRLRLYCLELSGQVAAMQYCYRFRNAIYVMQVGFDPDYSNSGKVLLTYMLESAIGEGHGVLDFLRGEHAHKEEFPCRDRETVYLTALRRSPGAWVYRARRLYLPKVKARLIRAVKELGLVKSPKADSERRDEPAPQDPQD